MIRGTTSHRSICRTFFPRPLRSKSISGAATGHFWSPSRRNFRSAISSESNGCSVACGALAGKRRGANCATCDCCGWKLRMPSDICSRPIRWTRCSSLVSRPVAEETAPAAARRRQVFSPAIHRLLATHGPFPHRHGPGGLLSVDSPAGFQRGFLRRGFGVGRILSPNDFRKAFSGQWRANLPKTELGEGFVIQERRRPPTISEKLQLHRTRSVLPEKRDAASAHHLRPVVGNSFARREIFGSSDDQARLDCVQKLR